MELNRQSLTDTLRDAYPVNFIPSQYETQRQAAVLLLVRRDADGGSSILFTQRSSSMNSHAGEVAFPGGKRDPEDATTWHTALRECNEEIGLDSSVIERVATLPSAISRWGLAVHPWVAYVDSACKSQELGIRTSETEHIFWVPITHFSDTKHLSYDDFTRDGQQYQMPRWQYQDWSIWGLTAMITATFLKPVMGDDVVKDTDKWWQLGSTQP